MSGTQEDIALTTGALNIGYAQDSAERCIAKDLNLSIKPGQLVCLLGPNGVGKSTLIRTLAGMQAPLAGQVQIAGQNFVGIPPRERARLVSVVLTESIAAGMMDVYTMVSLGRHPYSGWFGSLNSRDRKRIEWALEAVGATQLVTRQVAELSDGERQKVSIARALAQETQVMLLDEPTAFLDLTRRVELMTILRNLSHSEKLGLLLSTHDLDLALRFADRLWLLTPNGQLIDGYPEAIAMSDDFARVFESEKLEWDPSAGSFRSHSTPCLKATVRGEGIAALWTRRALERLGFELIDDPNLSALHLQVLSEDCWHATRKAESIELTSIEAVIDWVLCENWSLGD